jgi:hypothetical protein
MSSAAVTIIVELWLDVNTKLHHGEVLMINTQLCRDVNSKLYLGEVSVMNSQIFAATLRIRLAGPSTRASVRGGTGAIARSNNLLRQSAATLLWLQRPNMVASTSRQ